MKNNSRNQAQTINPKKETVCLAWRVGDEFEGETILNKSK